MKRRLLLTLVIFTLVPLWTPQAALAATYIIYDDALASGWQNNSWAAVNLAAAAPARGYAAISVSYNAGYEGMLLGHPETLTTGFTRLRFFLHGGTSGGQSIQLYVKASNGIDGPKVILPAPSAGNWTEVQISLADLGATDTTIEAIGWQSRSNSPQPTFYVDDIALVTDIDPNAPVLSEGKVHPRAAQADGVTGVVLRARVTDAQGLGDVVEVSVDATALGRGQLVLRDDGRSADGAAGDGVYGIVTSVVHGRPAGEHILIASAQDQAGSRVLLRLGAFVILGAAGGAIPAGLPARIGYGTNEWPDEAGVDDWQGNSGVPWDYVYQYITYEWYQDGWGGDYVGRFVRHAWGKGYVPVVSVYMILGVPPTTGESAAAYVEKLKDPTTVRSYLAALTEAARQARGDKPVIFHLEPDFYGYMQSYSRSPDRAPGINPDDPSSIVVELPGELNALGYPDTLAGFGQRMVDLIHQQAPNALVAPHASAWATGREPGGVPASEVAGLAYDTATFMLNMGGLSADMFFVEWSDRDAGSGLRPWWDDTDLTLPRPARAIQWQSMLSAVAGKRLMLWQVPVGNMALNDICGRYRDNRAAYIFREPRAVFDSGVVAVLFGDGANCMTTARTDDGVLRDSGAQAYAPPGAPTGLILESTGEYSVRLRWNEVAEPDVWGYRVRFAPEAGVGALTQMGGPATAASIILPRAGVWRISIAAYDAMGNLSEESSSVQAITTQNAPASVYTPIVQR